jgi:hypothetical protein
MDVGEEPGDSETLGYGLRAGERAIRNPDDVDVRQSPQAREMGARDGSGADDRYADHGAGLPVGLAAVEMVVEICVLEASRWGLHCTTGTTSAEIIWLV